MPADALFITGDMAAVYAVLQLKHRAVKPEQCQDDL